MADDLMPEKLSPHIQWLRAGLEKHGKTQKELADHLGWDPSAMSRLLSGSRLLKVDELAEIAKFLNEPAPLGDLLIDAASALRLAIETVKASSVPDLGTALSAREATLVLKAVIVALLEKQLKELAE